MYYICYSHGDFCFSSLSDEAIRSDANKKHDYLMAPDEESAHRIAERLDRLALFNVPNDADIAKAEWVLRRCPVCKQWFLITGNQWQRVKKLGLMPPSLCHICRRGVTDAMQTD